jgi:predicted short-subunit dehydrogenase-like oxidoreductase (DUF2520 family)
MNGFSIIGAGRLGVCLARALAGKGLDLKFISDRNPGAAREGRRTVGRGRATSDNAKAALASKYVFVTVPDDSVAGVARGLSEAPGDWRGRFVFHTSGILPARLLSPLQRKGAGIASLHPAQSFPDKSAPAGLFKGITWGIEGDAEALREGERIIRRLGGNVLRLAASDKALYHTACSLASNAVAALGETAAGLLEETGIGRNQAVAVLFPLVQGTLQNVKNIGLEKALTGPVVRGDLGTVRLHLEVLENRPAIAAIYRGLALGVLKRTAGSGLSPARVRALRRLLEDG